MDKHISRWKQRGSTHAVLTVGLIVLLIGALGFIFYQNVIESQSALDTDESISPEIVMQSGEIQHAGITLQYPETWQLALETGDAPADDGAYDAGTINDDSGTPIGYVVSGIDQTEQSCKDADAGDLHIISIASAKGDGLYVARAVYYSKTDGYTPLVFLTDGGSVGHAKTCHPEENVSFASKNQHAIIGNYPFSRTEGDMLAIENFYATEAIAKQRFESDTLRMLYGVLLTAEYK